MKNIYTLLLFLFSILPIVNAQTYHQIVDTNKYWSVNINGIVYPSGSYSILETFFFSGDTLINNLTYNKLRKNSVDLLDTTVNDTTIYAASLREDNTTRKTYIIYPNDTLEKLIYNFSLNSGDTTTFFNNVTGWQKGILDSIDYIEINNICTKRFFIKDSLNNEGWIDLWIEGIGSLHGLIYPGVNFVDYGPYLTLWYVIENQDTIFQNSNIIQCITGIHEYPFQKINIDLYPNPFNAYTLIEFENHKKEKHTLTLYNSLGQLVRQIDNITTGQIRIERNNLTNGLYFFQLRTDSEIIGNRKFIIE